MESPVLEVHVRHEIRPSNALVFHKEVITAGRKASNDIVLDEDGISRIHARLSVKDAQICVEDVSTNGTFLVKDGVRTKISSTHQLGCQAVIDIGRFSLQVKLRHADSATRAPPAPTGTKPVSAAPVIAQLDDEPLPEHINLPARSTIVQSPPDDQPVATTALADLPSFPAELHHEPNSLHFSRRRRSSIADIYRRLSEHFGAHTWGHAVEIEHSRLPEVVAAAKTLLAQAHAELGDWSTRLAHEVCGMDPLSSVLRDPTVSEVTVQGAVSLDLVRGAQTERSPRTFSCLEAVHAALSRLTGLELSESEPLSYTDDEFEVHGFSSRLVPHGPLLIVRRVAPFEKLHALPDPALHYVRRAVQTGASLVFSGGINDNLSLALRSIAEEVPSSKMLVVVQRSGVWAPTRALILDGHRAPHDLWMCVGRIHREWLIVEELNERDITYARDRPRGGLMSTLRLAPLDTEPDLLATELFNVHVKVRSDESGTLITSIAEAHSHGWVELFAEHGDGVLSATGASPRL